MKKIAVILAAMLLSSPLLAQEQHSDYYASAGIGVEAMPEDYDGGIGLSVKGGMKLDQVLPHFGAEAELTTSLVSPQNPAGNDINVFTLGAYATYTIVIPNSSVSVRPKFGLIFPNLSDDINSRDIAVSSGLAGLFKLNKQMDLYVEYVNASEYMNNYMVGLEVGF
jgi:hypothetical protein